MARTNTYIKNLAKKYNRIFVTGGSGFIGTNFIRSCLDQTNIEIVNLDKLTYASNRCFAVNISEKNYKFVQGSINCIKTVNEILENFKPEAIFNFAAESHVDNSINENEPFVTTNFLGVYNLIEATRQYFHSLQTDKKKKFRFVHISTDEVYGDQSEHDLGLSTENCKLKPSSPYSASKAAAECLFPAWERTYGLPYIITNCSNNYGPYQHYEKFIPKVIFNSLNKKIIPIYGDGLQIREWIHVSDHVNAIATLAVEGVCGNKFNIGTGDLVSNIDVVETIHETLETQYSIDRISLSGLITKVEDRVGHDRKYAISSSKISRETSWKPIIGFKEGILDTINWYVSAGVGIFK